MDKTNKILLNKTKSYNSINVNSQIQFGMDSTNKPIPLNDISTNINQFDQFIKERKESTIYRFYGNVIPIISNPLYNDNIKISRSFKFGTSGIEPSFDAKKILTNDIFEKDGWIGYYNDELDESALQFNDNKSALCEFLPFDPGYNRLSMLDSDGVPNYLFKVTYPFRSKDITLVRNNDGVTLKNGVPIIEKFIVNLNGRDYVGFKTAMNHGLSDQDEISLFNFIDNTPNQTLVLTQKTYRVFKLGNQTNDLKFRTFIIDLNPLDIDFTIGVSTIKRVVQDKLSQYYVREFKSLTSSNYKDYDVYPAAFGVSYYDDKISSFNFKKDVDVDGLVDNLGRPLSELYFTIIKNDSDTDTTSVNSQYWLEQQENLPVNLKNRFWTPIIGGYDIENNENVNYNVRSYGDPTFINNEWYPNIDESDDIFDGDIVEYNESELLERRLELVHHRINTIYREHLNLIDSNKEDKREGYIYKPFNRIQIREFSNFINPIVDLQYVIDKYKITDRLDLDNLRKSFGIPSYATEIAPNVFKWRDLLEIGEVDTTGGGVDYPFESGAHYINLDKRFYLQRQDPPCEFIIIGEEITLGATAPANDEQRFTQYLTDPTFLNYSFEDPTLIAFAGGGVTNLTNYNGLTLLKIDVNLADFIGSYELGKRDVAGGCVDLSLLKQKNVDDVC
jgi:hypothetical protein